jgi:hypothetical protein
MTGSKKSTFADDTADFAADVQEFVEYVGEELEGLREKHAYLAAEAKPEADEGDVWSQLSRTTGTFPDVDRALAMLASTVRDLSDAAAATLAGRKADGEDDSGDKKAEESAVKKSTDKSGDSKKSS